MAQEYTARVRVRYAETDQMGVVYYGNYFTWFEIGRAEMLRSLGLSYHTMEQEGAVLPVAKASCRYRMPARYDDEVLIRTRCVALRGALVVFGYRLFRAVGLAVDHNVPGVPGDASEYVLLAEGETTHVVVDRSLARCPMPEKYASALRATMGDAD
jgi:acyl-CoA thioester hydrolase